MSSTDTGYGVKGLMIRQGKVLLLEKHDKGYDLPGGRLEIGEDSRDGLYREMREEIGLPEVEITDRFVPWTFINRSGVAIKGTTWLCYFNGGPISLSSEHVAFRWIPPNELQGLDIHQKYGLDRFNLNSIRE